MFRDKVPRALVSCQEASDLLKTLLSNNQLCCSAADLRYFITSKEKCSRAQNLTQLSVYGLCECYIIIYKIV